jgi:hypothetical protein
VERQGGAQGLVEVLVALGSPQLEEGLANEVFSRVHDADARAREGALWALVFLPSALERTRMLGLLDQALGCALEALGDEAEPVRDAAHRAGRVYVTQFAESEPKLVLPPLERGLVAASWRVRQSSVRLLGDVVAKLVSQDKAAAGAGAAGGSSRQQQDEHMAQGLHTDDTPAPEGSVPSDEEEDDDSEEDEAAADDSEGPADLALLRTFGAERRDMLVARVYLLRNDVSSAVRQTALFVWKGLISNTPRTLRRVVRPLMECVIQGLSDARSEERQQVAGKTLGDVVRKLGDRVLPQIVPLVVQGLEIGAEEQRRGVALGLHELIASAAKKDLEPHAAALLGALLRALCDESADVRQSAGRSFGKIHQALGGSEAIAAVVAPLVDMLELPGAGSERAVWGLEQAVAAKPKDVMAFLLPRLLQPPLSDGRARALAATCDCVAAHADYYVRPVLRPVVQQLAARDLGPPSDTDSVLWRSAVHIVLALAREERGATTLVPELVDAVGAAGGDESRSRRAALALLGALFAQSQGFPLDNYVPVVLKTIVRQFADADAVVLGQAVAAFSSVVKRVGALSRGRLLGAVAEGGLTATGRPARRVGARGLHPQRDPHRGVRGQAPRSEQRQGRVRAARV